MNIRLVIVAACTVAGCGGGEGLAREDVDDLPGGNARGTAATGSYDVELYTRSCDGACAVEVDGFTVGLCDVGEVDSASLDVTQTDGRLVMDADGLVVDRLTGGIDEDGSFTVGAWSTEMGGALELRVLSTGSLAGLNVTGDAEARAIGMYDGQRIDCTAIYDLTGTRL